MTQTHIGTDMIQKDRYKYTDSDRKPVIFYKTRNCKKKMVGLVLTNKQFSPVTLADSGEMPANSKCNYVILPRLDKMLDK